MPPRGIRQVVRKRADFGCEYCHFHEEHLPLWPFHLDHIIPRQHGGQTIVTNLAWACQRCNLCKGTNLVSIDPASGQIVPLFNPRDHMWEQHFRMQGCRIGGTTPTGRATISLLQMNSQERLELRAEIIALDEWR